jgi:hypothetical protein
MEAAKDGRFDDAAVRVRGPRRSRRDLLGEPLMRSVGVDVARVVGENAFEVTFAEDEEVIEAFASHAIQEALADRIGSRSPDGRAKDARSDPGGDSVEERARAPWRYADQPRHRWPGPQLRRTRFDGSCAML